MNIKDTLIKPEVASLVNRYSCGHILVTKEEYQTLFLNSYERFLLYPCLDIEALLEVCKVCNENITGSRNNPITYNEVAAEILFPLLITKLQELKREIEEDEELMRNTEEA